MVDVMNETKIINVIGTYIGKDETKKLHTSTCQCGKTIVRASKRESLKHYTDNPKWTAKCCRGMLAYSGEKFFKGKELFIEVPTIIGEINQNSNGEIDSLIVSGKKGITNFQMIPALKNNIHSTDNLRLLFHTYEDVFIKSVKYVKDEYKLILLNIINEKYPNAILDTTNPKTKHIILKEGA